MCLFVKHILSIFCSWRNRHKYSIIISAGLILSLVISAGLSLVFLTTSINNYPGGNAFRTVHTIIVKTQHNGGLPQRPYSVHIGVEAAMTGVSRFGETQPTWIYSKNESIQHGSQEMMEYDFLLISSSDYHYYNSTHSLIHKETGFSRLSLNYWKLPPIRIVIEDKIYVLKRKGV